MCNVGQCPLSGVHLTYAASRKMDLFPPLDIRGGGRVGARLCPLEATDLLHCTGPVSETSCVKNMLQTAEFCYLFSDGISYSRVYSVGVDHSGRAV